MSSFQLEPSPAHLPDSNNPMVKVPSLLASVLVHLLLLIMLGMVTIPATHQQAMISLFASALPPQPEPPLMLETLQVDEMEVDRIGANGLADRWEAAAVAPMIGAVTDVPPPDMELSALRPVSQATFVPDPYGRDPSEMVVLRGSGGTAATGAAGAIDRITHEILLSLEQRPTLVVWLLDQSGSLTGQRKQIDRRLARIYREIGQVRSAGLKSTTDSVEPLLSSVIAFGSQISLRTDQPTADVTRLQEAIRSIEVDRTGIENAFAAVQFAVKKYRRERMGTPSSPARNVMLVLFCDEVGDDQHLMDKCVTQCQRLAIPVYVVGIPAPFGREETFVKWVDPDPAYDQTPRWGQVNQGPESLQPELLRLQFVDDDPSYHALDSGFGPYALTRLCVETGGIYFTVHPNRQTERQVSPWETAPYSAFVRQFFPPEVMRRYKPDYVTAHEYQRRLKDNRDRAALVAAAQTSWLAPLENPQRRFVFRDEAQFAQELSEAQKAAARLAPKYDELYRILKEGEPDRQQEESPRWKAGFDLAIGRVLAMKVRTDGYNAMLAAAKGGLPSDNPRNNTWTLQSSAQILAGSRLEGQARTAEDYLRRVVADHPQTPWALLAAKELETPLGWRWVASFTDLNPPRQTESDNGGSPTRQDDQRQMIARPAPARPVPRL